MISNKSILVTGASGFIGSHLCDFFIKNNNKVTGVDNLSTGKLENLSMLKNEKNKELKLRAKETLVRIELLL